MIPLRPVRHVSAILIALVTLVAAVQPDVVRTFDEDRVGVPPVGFVFSGTAPDRWLVRRERDNRDNNVLAHGGDPDQGRGQRIALAVLDGRSQANVSVAARVTLAAGDGRGGFVWRYQDRQNYYMVRLDLADEEIGLYRVVSGNRIRIKWQDDLELRRNDWHVLKVVHASETIRVYLGGIKVFDVRDRTFRAAGGVGLWSSGDAVMYFDNLSLEGGDGR